MAKKKEFPKVIRQGYPRNDLQNALPRFGRLHRRLVRREKRLRKLFNDLAAAELQATAMVNNLSRGEARVVKLSGEQLLEYNRACEFVKEFGMSLDAIAAEYRDAKGLVRGKCLAQVAQYYASKNLLDLPEKTMVTEKEAKAWFAITPEAVKPVREKEEWERAERERQEAAKIVHFPVTAAA